jgi:assimilatory nitrate reductase catalytic subunit
MFRLIEKGEIRGLISMCFNPKVSLPDSTYVAAMLDKLDFYVALDFFLNETAHHADIVLPSALHEEDEGTVTQVEGRVIKINKAIEPPGEARQDWKILQDIAHGLGRDHGFHFSSPAEIWEELRRASKGGVADYSGISYQKIEAQQGVFWPCYDEAHKGTPRLFEPGTWNPIAKDAGPFYFPDGKARFNAVEYAPPAEDIDDEYPYILTTGRVISHFLSGTQTRRIGPLVDQHPDPWIEIHPQLAEKLGFRDGMLVTAQTRRGAITLTLKVVKTIRPDTVFIPYHWPGDRSANRLTNSAQDPISKIPEYKACAVRLLAAGEPTPNGGSV